MRQSRMSDRPRPHPDVLPSMPAAAPPSAVHPHPPPTPRTTSHPTPPSCNACIATDRARRHAPSMHNAHEALYIRPRYPHPMSSAAPNRTRLHPTCPISPTVTQLHRTAPHSAVRPPSGTVLSGMSAVVRRAAPALLLAQSTCRTTWSCGDGPALIAPHQQRLAGRRSSFVRVGSSPVKGM